MKRTIPTFLIIALSWIETATSLAGDSHQSQQETVQIDSPNVLFLFADDLQWNAIGAMGNADVITPNLDALVQRGFTFRRTYCMGSNSGAVCGPSRAMILTGRSLDRAMGQGFNPAPGAALWPERFRDAGYRTFGTGKWHNGKGSFARCFDAGGAIFFGGMHDPAAGGHWRPAVWPFDSTGTYAPERRMVVDRFSSTLFADETIEFLNDHARNDDDRPFMAYVSFTAPHDPRHAPQEVVDLYAGMSIDLPPNVMAEHPFDNGELKVRDERLGPQLRTPSIVRHHLLQYYAMVTQLDAEVGRILTALDESGLSESTIVVFTADHGLGVGQHGLLGKQNLYEHSARAPLILAGPGIPEGESSESLTYLHDIGPTLLHLAKLPPLKDSDGRSLLPVLDRPETALRPTVQLRYRHFQRAVRDDRFKLIHYRVDGVESYQLFDLDQDPFEMNNLFDDERLLADRTRLMGLLPPWLPGA